MKLFLWVRAFLGRNFYNWRPEFTADDELQVVLADLKDHLRVEVGMQFVVLSVHRTTGRLILHEDNFLVRTGE